MQYVELHARSAFSFLEGASVPEALGYACAAQQLPGMALLDRNGPLLDRYPGANPSLTRS